MFRLLLLTAFLLILFPLQSFGFDFFEMKSSQIKTFKTFIEGTSLTCMEHQNVINAVKIKGDGDIVRVQSYDFLRKRRKRKIRKRFLSGEIKKRRFVSYKKKIRTKFKRIYTNICRELGVAGKQCDFNKDPELATLINNSVIGLECKPVQSSPTSNSDSLEGAIKSSTTEDCTDPECEEEDTIEESENITKPKFITWSNYIVAGTNPMIWTKMNYGHSATKFNKDYDDIRPVDVVASEVIEQLKTRPPEERVIFLWYFGSTKVNGVSLNSSYYKNPNGQDTTREYYTNWYKTFWLLLQNADVTPNYVVLDYEAGANFWQAQSTSIPSLTGYSFAKSDPRGFNEYLNQIRSWGFDNSSLANLSAVDFLHEAGNIRRNITNLNNTAEKIKSKFIQEIVFDTFEDIYGISVPGSNYSHALVSEKYYSVDKNNWYVPSHNDTGRTPGGWSSPVTYLGIGGNRYNLFTPYKEYSNQQKLAQSWLDQRNLVRAALDTHKKVAPWYSNPGYELESEADWQFWKAGIIEDWKCGIDTFLIWASNFTSKEKVYFDQTIKDLKNTNRICNPIPKDVHEVFDVVNQY